MTEELFNYLLIGMTATGLIVFVSLYYITAGYGLFHTKEWGFSINNKVGWVLMEAPAFLTMLGIWYASGCPLEAPEAVLLGLFMLHYFQRSFIFPFLMAGRSSMPITIMLSGVTFNVINGIMQGGALFWFPQEAYAEGWSYLESPTALMGFAVFFIGMGINLHSDHVIRSLRKPGDSRHYLPQGGMYHFVTSGNYLGEIIEWTGYAILAGSPAAWVFVWWTAANLVPRAHAIHKKYRSEFGNAAVGNRKRVFPFIY